MAGLGQGVIRHLGRIASGSTALFICDIQEGFRKTIQYYPEMIHNTARLIQAAKLLDMPIIVTEQYPKGLGSTVSELIEHLPADTRRFDKTLFSMCVPQVFEDGRLSQVDTVILTGIESHVCVVQTALDLLAKQYTVHIAVDCISSRSLVDRKFAIDRLMQSGVFVTTSESMILQLCKDAGHGKFKPLQKLIWNASLDTGLLSLIPDSRVAKPL